MGHVSRLPVSAALALSALMAGSAAAVPPAGGVDLTSGEPVEAARRASPAELRAGAEAAPATQISVLWDLSHGPYDTGTYDYSPESHYSGFTALMGTAGYPILGGEAPLTAEALAGVDVLVLAVTSAWVTPYSEAEADVVLAFVEGGGGLILLCESPNARNVNVAALSARLGVGCGSGSVSANLYAFTAHPITLALTHVTFGLGGGITAASPSQALLFDKTVPVGAAATLGAGRALTLGDGNLWDNTKFFLTDNMRLGLNAFAWAAQVSDLDEDGDGRTRGQGDCNDGDPAVYPGAPELCDGVDQDCDLQIDEGVQTAYFPDADGDDYGDEDALLLACAPPEGYILDGADCDDGDAAINPGATEICDGRDNDCDGGRDEDLLTAYYPDLDGDGYGDDAALTQACAAPEGYIEVGGDCDDANPDISPDADEIPANGVDDDCDGLIDDATPTLTPGTPTPDTSTPDTPTQTPDTPTETPDTPTALPTPTLAPTPSPTPSATPTASLAPTPSAGPTPTAGPTPSATPLPTPTATATLTEGTPSQTPLTPTASPSPAPSATEAPTATAGPSPSPSPSDAPTPTATAATPSDAPTPTLPEPTPTQGDGIPTDPEATPTGDATAEGCACAQGAPGTGGAWGSLLLLGVALIGRRRSAYIPLKG